jgi:hypothetical protein
MGRPVFMTRERTRRLNACMELMDEVCPQTRSNF